MKQAKRQIRAVLLERCAMSADGPEEREAERLADELAADRRHEAAEARADELHDLMLAICRPSCTLIGHDPHPTKGYCRFCAKDLP